MVSFRFSSLPFQTLEKGKYSLIKSIVNIVFKLENMKLIF